MGTPKPRSPPPTGMACVCHAVWAPSRGGNSDFRHPGVIASSKMHHSSVWDLRRCGHQCACREHCELVVVPVPTGREWLRNQTAEGAHLAPDCRHVHSEHSLGKTRSCIPLNSLHTQCACMPSSWSTGPTSNSTAAIPRTHCYGQRQHVCSDKLGALHGHVWRVSTSRPIVPSHDHCGHRKPRCLRLFWMPRTRSSV